MLIQKSHWDKERIDETVETLSVWEKQTLLSRTIGAFFL
jgi:hypothetical protein